MSDSYSQLKQLATAIQPLSENEWSAFSSIWTECTAKGKEPLTVAGEKEKYLYFVIEGMQRVYYFDELPMMKDTCNKQRGILLPIEAVLRLIKCYLILLFHVYTSSPKG